MPHFSTMRATFLCKIRYLNIGAKNQQSFLSKTVWLIISNIVKLNPKKDRSEGMISRFQECMWKVINSQYIYWIYRLFSSPFKFKKLKEFFLSIRKWCCIVQEIVVVVLYWFVSGESFKRLSPCLKMGTYSNLTRIQKCNRDLRSSSHDMKTSKLEDDFSQMLSKDAHWASA